MSLRICFLNHIEILGGGEIWVLNASRYLADLQHRVFVACPLDSPLYKASREQGLEVLGYRYDNEFTFTNALYRFLTEKEIDILYCTIIGGFCEASLLEPLTVRINRERPSSPMILILKTGLPPMKGLTSVYYGKGAGPALRRLHVVCKNIKKEILEWDSSISKDFVEVHYEGVDLLRFQRRKSHKYRDWHRALWNIPKHYQVVTCLARLHPMKGQEYLLRAIPGLLQHHPDTLFFFAGAGEDRSRLEQLSHQLKLDNHVRFPGHVNDVPSLLNATDILCHPSLGDGLPNSVMQAMAMSLPVVASQVGGIPELIEPGVSGFIIPPGDIEALESTLHTLLKQKILRQKIGKAARQKVEKDFDMQNCLTRLTMQFSKEWEEVKGQKEKSISVLFLLSVLRNGGEETELEIFARCLDHHRFSMSVLTCWECDETAPVIQTLNQWGISIDTTCCPLPTLEEKANAVILKIKKEKPDVVIACQDPRVAYLAFRGLGPHECRLIEHGGISEEMDFATREFTARYVAVSKEIRDKAAMGMNRPEHAVFIPSMVDTRSYENLEKKALREAMTLPMETCVITFVGRLDPKKRLEILLLAAADILAQFTNVLFLVIGGHDAYSPAYASDLIDKARFLTDSGRFIFTGPRRDIPQLLTASDILVLPSINEGMSHVINEAGAAGLAVISTQIGAAADQLEQGKCGRLIPPDNPAALTRALRELINDKTLRETLGNRLKKKVYNEYSARVLLPQWETILTEVAGEKTGTNQINGYLVKGSGNHRSYPGFPLEIQVQTSTFCNARCIMCPYPEVNQEVSQGRMKEPLYEKILDQCAHEPLLRRIEPFLMNEPFTDKGIVQRIALAKKAVPQSQVTLTTNGALLTPKVMDKLVTSGLDAIWFSFNGATRSTYEKNMGISYSRVKKNIEYLLSIRPPTLQVFVNMIETLPMKAEIAENIRYWQQQGVQAGTSPLVNRAGNVNRFLQLNYRQLSNIRKVCDLVFYKMFILYNGDVVLCCMDWRRKVVLGNLYRETLKEIWQGKQYNQIRQQHLEGTFSTLELCAHCSYIVC